MDEDIREYAELRFSELARLSLFAAADALRKCGVKHFAEIPIGGHARLIVHMKTIRNQLGVARAPS